MTDEQEKQALPGEDSTQKHYGRIYGSLSERTSERDHPILISGFLTDKPHLCPYGRNGEYLQAKFRVLVVKNVYPTVCIALFNLAQFFGTLEKGDHVVVGGYMRYFTFDTGKSKYPIMQVTTGLVLPRADGYDISDFIQRIESVEAQIKLLNEDNKIIKDQMDAYGIKVQKKKDWREGAEPGSLW